MPKKGRKGAEQRVKGNVKSASSGRMTELLGGEAMGFIGFDSVSGGLPSPLSTAAGGDEIDGGVGGDKMEELILGSGAKFQVVMKQLGKRDTTTKLKALQNFCGLCSDEPSQEVVAVLNIWSLMYNKLSMDNDNRVRALSHKALKSCAVSVKSSLAPHLKSIIGSSIADQISMSWLRRFLKLESRARLIGEDLRGNKYFEEIAEGGRRAKRSVKVKEFKRLEEYDQETVPPEWDRWLRGLRKDPPSTEEQALRIQQSEVLKHRVAGVQKKDAELRDKEIVEGLVADESPRTKTVDHASGPSYKPHTVTNKEPTSTGKDFTPGSWKP